MNRLFLIALLAVITGTTAAHAGYYDRAQKSRSARQQQTPDQWQRNIDQQMNQRLQKQNEQQWQDEDGEDFAVPTY